MNVIMMIIFILLETFLGNQIQLQIFKKSYIISFTNIKTIPKFVSYETYATLENLGYRLNIGEEYEGNVIENVEGTEGGDIVYYTDKILSVDENEEEKKGFKDRLSETIKYYDNELN